MAEDDLLTFDELRTVQSDERSRDTLQELGDDFFSRAQDYLDLKRDPESHLENREYRNARRVIEDIVDQRQKKIMKLAFLSVKSDLHVENLLPREKELFEQVRDIIRDHRSAMQDRIFEVDGSTTRDDIADAPDMEAPAEEDSAADAAANDTGENPDEDTEAEQEASGDDPADDEPAADGDTIFGEPGPGDRDDAEAEDEEEAAIFDGDSTEAAEAAADTSSSTEPDPDGEDGVHIRIAESVPAFMGTDLEPYGPYDPGDETRVPEKNASILVEKGKAERVE